jgi:hypothetical protein
MFATEALNSMALKKAEELTLSFGHEFSLTQVEIFVDFNCLFFKTFFVFNT